MGSGSLAFFENGLLLLVGAHCQGRGDRVVPVVGGPARDGGEAQTVADATSLHAICGGIPYRGHPR
jgi:hypothetical protein